MKVLAAYLLAVLGGNADPSAEDLKHILGSVGAEADDDRIELLLSQVRGKDLAELIAAGREKLAAAAVSCGGGAAVSATASAAAADPAPAAAADPAPAAAAAAEAKEEKAEEESDDEPLFSLFD